WGMSFGSNLLASSIGQIQEFFYAPNGKFYIRVSGGVTGIWETSDFVNFNAITATLPNYAYLNDMSISDNYIYAITDTNLYRYPLGTTSVTETYATKPTVKVYPNPATDLLHVSISDNTLIEYMELTNVYGAVVARSARSESTVNIHLVPPGIYYLKVATGG